MRSWNSIFPLLAAVLLLMGMDRTYSQSDGYIPEVPEILPMPDLSDPLAPGPVVPVKPKNRDAEVVALSQYDVVWRPESQDAEIVEVPVDPDPIQSPYVPGALVPREKTQVSILGYHDFHPTKAPTRMRMKTADFRAQILQIKESGATVISLEDFMQWKNGTKTLPARCVLITLDDGWKSVYTDAYPIMKEYGYPFTLFLYTKYVNSGGASLTWDMIKEMMKNGASVGSHSVSHPYPSDYRRAKRAGAENYDAFIKKELAESKKILEENLGITVESFCYPGGYKPEEMYPLLKETGYKAAFDVLPGKTETDTSSLDLPRYMVLGDALGTFKGSLEWKGSDNTAGSGQSVLYGPVPRQIVAPKANSVQKLGLHPISINLSTVNNLNPNSVIMRVSGLGKVPGHYNNQTKTYTWVPNRLLRGVVTVQVSWMEYNVRNRTAPVEWKFKSSEYVEEPPPAGWIP